MNTVYATVAERFAKLLLVGLTATAVPLPPGRGCRRRKRRRAARSLGATPAHAFRRVTLPLAARGVLTGAVLVYARSISEFGAVVILAYYPATAPVQIYTLFLTSGLTDSASAAVLLLVVSLATFLVLRTLASGWLLTGANRAHR